MTGPTLELVTYFIIAIIFITVVLNVIQMFKGNKYKKELERLEKSKNQVISAPIMNELSKAETLVKNERIEERFHGWQKRFAHIKEKAIPEINDLLLEADFIIDQKKYDALITKIANIEMKLYEARTKTDRLMVEIQEITLSEEKNRKIITTLKTLYRELLQNFETMKEDYGGVTKSIELQFENIERRFQEFETAMENNDYDEVSHIVRAIDDMIKHMQVVIEEVPSIVLTIDNVLPQRINDATLMYDAMTREGFQLDYLNVEYNVDEIKKKVNDIVDRVKVLNLEDVIFELKTFLEYFDNLFNDFEREKLTKKVFEEEVINFRDKLTKTTNVVNEVYAQIRDIKYNYDLSDKDIESLEEIKQELTNLSNDFKALHETTRARSFPFSKLNKELEVLFLRIMKVEERLEDIIQSIGSMKDDEKRAREQLDTIKDLLKKSKYKIREYKLPIIPNNYFVELKEAQAGVKEIVKELEKTPINTETLNTRVDTARDLVLKLYNTTGDLIKTAQMAEASIIYGNRYRSTKHQIEEGLNKAEMLFIKGEYKKALDLTISTIDIVEPDIHKHLLSLYGKE